jgi:hypothetical protein
MLVITGMGRSGTSVLAGFCRQLGFDPGGGFHEGINAGLEDAEVVSINEHLMRHGRENLPVGEPLLERIRRFDRALVKDPRFVIGSGAVLAAWWRERHDLRILLTVRDSDDAVRSRQAHPHWFGDIPDDHARALRNDVTGTLWLMASLDIPFRCLRFPDFLRQPERVFEALRFGGLSFPEAPARRMWQRLIDFRKVRHSPGWQSV